MARKRFCAKTENQVFCIFLPDAPFLKIDIKCEKDAELTPLSNGYLSLTPPSEKLACSFSSTAIERYFYRYRSVEQKVKSGRPREKNFRRHLPHTKARQSEHTRLANVKATHFFTFTKSLSYGLRRRPPH
jgi:hypothetical protein